jgi:hypothetical protein
MAAHRHIRTAGPLQQLQQIARHRMAHAELTPLRFPLCLLEELGRQVYKSLFKRGYGASKVVAAGR